LLCYGWQEQTCQPLIKENLDTHEKISGDSTKNSEIPLFSRLRENKISAASVLILFAIFIRLQLLSRAARELAKTTGLLAEV